MTVKVTSSTRQPEAREASYAPTPFRLFDRMFEDMFNEWADRTGRSTRQPETWVPRVDVLEKEGNLVITADLPGIQEKEIDLKLEGNVLTIAGERKMEEQDREATCYQIEGRYGNFLRYFSLPDSVDSEKISAAYANGVLTVTIPPRPEVKSRSIKIGIQK